MDIIKDYEPNKVQTPKKCIRDYCLMHCTAKGRLNSKRDVVECSERDCPLHPYRTGMLKARSGPINDEAKRRRIAEMEQARRWLHNAEDKYIESWQKYKNAELKYDERMAEKHIALMEEEAKYGAKYADKVSRLKQESDFWKTAIEKRAKRVRELELRFNEQLEAGIWNTRRLDVDEPEECAQEDEQTSETEGE